MNHLIIKLTILIAVFIGAALTAMGQTVDTTGLAETPVFEDPATIGQLVENYQLLYGALVIIWGWVAKAFGLKAKVPNFVFVVVAGGAVIAAAFIFYGFNVFPLILSFLSAIGLYDIFLKPAEKWVKKMKAKQA